jgi:lipid-binding SYLF domain-containing protein
MRSISRLTAFGLAAVMACALPAAARAQTTEEAERIGKAIEVVRDLTAVPEEGIPQYLLQRAEAIVVIPNLVRGGFIVGAKHGKGIVSSRNAATGEWSTPAFVQMTGGSIGWQIGVQSVDVVLLVMNKKGLDELLEDKFTIGGSLSVAAGPIGRSAEAATDAQLSAGILAYSRAKGLFAGATFEGAALRADDDANEDFYAMESTLRQIMAGQGMTAPPAPVVAEWKALLRRVTK